MVGEEYRLGPLQVSVPGYEDCLIAPGQLDQRTLYAPEPLECGIDRLLDVKPHVEGDLVVAGAAGVETPRSRADQLAQPRLDVHVQVFQDRVPRKRTFLYFFLDAPQPPADFPGVPRTG